jgi:hypothetical protein
MSIKHIVAASLLAFAGIANAGFYVGGEVNSTDVSSRGLEDVVDEFSDRGVGWGALVGYQWGNFGAEASWLDSTGISEVDVSGAEVDADGWTVSGLGYIPLTDKWSIVGKAGYFDFDADLKDSEGTTSLEGESGFLYGAGVSWEFVNNFDARLLATIYDAESGSINQVSLGLLYSF